MFRKKRNFQYFDIWPAYVDILATVLMVLIFVLMTFVMAQMYLSESITDKDQLIHSLNKKIAILDNGIKDESQKAAEALKMLNTLENQLKSEMLDKKKLNDQNYLLSSDMNKLIETLKHLEVTLEEEVGQNKKDKLTITDLKESILTLERKLGDLDVENKDLVKAQEKHKELTRVHSYRSEFFSKLKDVVGDTENIKVVGDRFIFQSELLFEVGSADLEAEGTKQLKQLSQTLKEIGKKIPEDLNWILRVDGHTDKKPIKSTFPSNWELSAARAIAVVKFLIEDGIDPKRLVAAGFGEYQPLVQEKGDDSSAAARNRRIEFKLDQR